MTDTNDRRVTELEQENADLRAEMVRLETAEKYRARAEAAEAERDQYAAQIEAARALADYWATRGWAVGADDLRHVLDADGGRDDTTDGGQR